jgi:chromosome segregation ATPase
MTQDVTVRLRALAVETGDATLQEAAETIAALRAARDGVHLAYAKLHQKLEHERGQMKALESRLTEALSQLADATREVQTLTNRMTGGQ